MNKYFVKNSKEINQGDVFVSIAGKNNNGNDYILEAVNNGASKIIVQKNNPVNKDILNFLENKNIDIEYVDDAYYTFAENIKKYYNEKFSHITFIGVTGTKGKTSTCNAIFNLLRANNCSTGLMSTAFHKINNIIKKATLTTEMINKIYKFIEEANNHNVTHIILEVSAQAFSQYRIYGIQFDAFIFTNFSTEHSECYKSQNDYFQAKCELYNYLKPNAIVLLNQDDEKVLSSIDNTNNKNYRLKTFSHIIENKTDIYYNIQSNFINHSKGIIYYKENTFLFNSSWVGIYNIGNIACALLIIDELLKLNQQKIIFLLKQCEYFENIPGRNERYYLSNNRTICIEKAHTANSVLATLEMLHGLTNNLIVLFGLGGEKDTQKRPIVASIIENLANTIYVSTDNPRNEPIEKIFQDIAKGFIFKKDIYFIQDRKKAIEMAIENSLPESIIVLLGKGDEEYQEIKNKFYYFSEKEIIKKYIK